MEDFYRNCTKDNYVGLFMSSNNMVSGNKYIVT